MELKALIKQIVSSPELHAKWLNSLSMMENTGARKISASEHDQLVDEIVLKHAAEEARHAYYLKSQIKKTGYEGCKTYLSHELLAPIQSFQYLHALDASISRYLKNEMGFEGNELKYAAYLLVTYAIEVRADDLYPVYEEVLRENDSKISVRMIVVEEQGHLEEMIQQMDEFFVEWKHHAEFVEKLENQLFEKWIEKVDEMVKPQPELI
ncbi:hypothetical protein SAMN05421640_0446 [Ekhidna lutea]|uniref:Rubrerythrin n=1 Tax=Ekhidna lutea TaxID=447679 RepID=A0A239F441_EKHLU|nr:hypothetical protein [Ekhidna lutea]SNS50874.1 hypothetical protein SAMN05421640_0446 [Ekhidna lutea]